MKVTFKDHIEFSKKLSGLIPGYYILYMLSLICTILMVCLTCAIVMIGYNTKIKFDFSTEPQIIGIFIGALLITIFISAFKEITRYTKARKAYAEFVKNGKIYPVIRMGKYQVLNTHKYVYLVQSFDDVEVFVELVYYLKSQPDYLRMIIKYYRENPWNSGGILEVKDVFAEAPVNGIFILDEVARRRTNYYYATKHKYVAVLYDGDKKRYRTNFISGEEEKLDETLT